MKLRTLNVSRRARIADFQHDAAAAVERIEREHADRDAQGNGVQRLHALMYDMAMSGDSDSLPNSPSDFPRVGSSQSVVTFQPVLMADTVHPDAIGFFHPEELAEVIEKAAERRVGSVGLYRHIDYVTPEGGVSAHGEMVCFMSEAQEKSDIAHQAKIEERKRKAQARAERAGLKFQEVQALGDPVALEEKAKARQNAEKFASLTRELKREVADRLKYGFYHAGPKALGGNKRIAGELYDEMHEYFGENCPYRSKLGSPSLARMAALYPSKGKVRAGNDKEALLETTSKLLALDSPYAELNRMWAGCITIELDSVWRSAAKLRAKLLTMLGPKMMPNLMVGRYTRDGLFARPHLIWVLKTPVYCNAFREWTDADTGEVKSSGDKDCRTAPIGKFHAVQRSLVSLLLDVGADPACHNVWKPKNPLSPFWSTIITNDDHWAGLDEFRHIPGYPKRAPSEHEMAELAHKMRAAAAGEAPATTNVIWMTCKAAIDQLVSRGRAGMDLDFRRAADKGQDALANFIDNTVRPEMEKALGESDALDRVLGKQCPFAARVYRNKMHKITKSSKIAKNEDGDRIRRVTWRGRDRGMIILTPEIDDAVDGDRRAEIEAEIRKTECKQRRQYAAERSAMSNSEKTYWWFAKCLTVWLSDASDPSWAAFRVSGAFDCCENTARKYFAKYHADRAAARAANTAKAAAVSSSPPTQNGDVRYIARPFTGNPSEPSFPSEVQQASPPTVPGLPRPGFQFDTSDPAPDHQRSTVNRPEPGRPPDPPWSTCAQSSADACLEPA